MTNLRFLPLRIVAAREEKGVAGGGIEPPTPFIALGKIVFPRESLIKNMLEHQIRYDYCHD
jgi:hypothetical protein